MSKQIHVDVTEISVREFDPMTGTEPRAASVPYLVDRPSFDLGPDPDGVMHILGRAGRLTADERRRLVSEFDWRAWPIAVPQSGSLATARTDAIVHGRAAGRGAAIDWLTDQAARAVGTTGPRPSHARRAVADAALAVSVADLIDGEVFERLMAPWRLVIH